MASLDNQNVTAGDQVYDLVWGYGTVTSTMFDTIQVRFGDGRGINYTSVGEYGGVRRLYWHNPIVIPPPRDNRLWGTLTQIMQTVAAQLDLTKP